MQRLLANVLCFVAVSAGLRTALEYKSNTSPAVAVQKTLFRAANPVPNASAIITLGNARFTVLTSQLVRLEYAGARAGQGGGDDRATLAVINRDLLVPQFTQSIQSGVLSTCVTV
jgi:hypothetical protein